METQFSKTTDVSKRVETICKNIRKQEKEIYRNIRQEVAEYKATLSGHPYHIRQAGIDKYRELTKVVNQRKANIIHAQCTKYQISVPYIQKILTKPEK